MSIETFHLSKSELSGRPAFSKIPAKRNYIISFVRNHKLPVESKTPPCLLSQNMIRAGRIIAQCFPGKRAQKKQTRHFLLYLRFLRDFSTITLNVRARRNWQIQRFINTCRNNNRAVLGRDFPLLFFAISSAVADQFPCRYSRAKLSDGVKKQMPPFSSCSACASISPPQKKPLQFLSGNNNDLAGTRNHINIHLPKTISSPRQRKHSPAHDLIDKPAREIVFVP